MAGKRRRLRKILKWTGIIIGTPILLVLLVGYLFLTFSPQFGDPPGEDRHQEFAATGHWEDGVFTNDLEIVMNLDCHSITAMAKEMLQPDPNVVPIEDVPVESVSSSFFDGISNATRIIWLGHSSFYLEMDGKRILLDPIFGKVAAPHEWLGRERFNSTMPFSIADLPQLDAIVISHDHYDHLDYPSIEELKGKTDHFFVPLGVGGHLQSWDIEADRIHEMDWWDETELGSLKIAFTPSRHMSGRGISDQSCTLWGSWVFTGQNDNLYFSGDGGYGDHFKTIGEKYGPFTLGLMECGQYNEKWADVHMMPEQTAIATQDVGAAVMIPIHWGAFSLAPHSWTDPIERVTAECERLGVPIATPRIGEPIVLPTAKPPHDRWWEELGKAPADE